ncbi:hypothetical protein CAP35_12590 [Chitinophagaceae bacterium IBVUCB1]|nr:hypothetical protein CAP35_12590 [Chitinophagaceae bacterium IBVUCB1]
MARNDKAPKGARKEQSIDDWFYEVVDKLNSPDQFTDEAFKHLPGFFSSLVELFIDRQQQETALFCSLVLISGALPNYRVVYDGDQLDANLFGYLYGPAGSGKGLMKKCKQLLVPIHKEKRLRTITAYEKYLQQLQSGKRKKKGKGVVSEDVDEESTTSHNDKVLLPPPDEMLFLPANNTKSNIYQLMEANKGVVICESEAMVLTTALKQEHGAFVDLLLQAFHHETYSYSRKSDRTIEIEHPLLTVLLSSTPKHIVRFFNDVENGLYSRFIFYRLNSSSEFRNPFEEKGSNIDATIDTKAQLVKKVYDYLSSLGDMPLYFSLTSSQKDKMYTHFKLISKEYKTQFGDDMDGVVKRYGVIFVRVAMILSLFRTHEKEGLQKIDQVICTEDDFICSMSIIETLFGETLKVYEMLTLAQRLHISETVPNSLEVKIAQQKQFIELYNAGLSMSEIAKQVLGNPALKPTVWRQLKKLGVHKSK